MNSRLTYFLLLSALILLAIVATAYVPAAFHADETVINDCGDPVDGGHPAFTLVGDPVDGGHPYNRTGNHTG